MSWGCCTRPTTRPRPQRPLPQHRSATQRISCHRQPSQTQSGRRAGRASMLQSPSSPGIAPPRYLQAAGLEPTGHYADKEHQSRTSSVSPTTGHGPAARERHWLCFERCFAAVFQGTRDKISHFILFLFLFLPLILRSDALATPPSYQGRAGPSRRPGSQGQGDDALSFLPALPAPP